jgi:hypothetical protein
MATTFKNFLNSDLTNTRTLLHEAIPMTGSILSGTYITNTETNIKNFGHGMFQSVYDYPYLSSSANHIVDITVGMSASSPVSASVSSEVTQQAKKINIYNQMAQVLMGYNATGSAIRGFDRDGNTAGGSAGLSEVFFLSFSRLLTKDEIKKGSFTIDLFTGSSATGAIDNSTFMTISDYNAANNYRVNSPAGEYGLLLTSSTALLATDKADSNVAGLIFYQAGIAVLTASVFGSALAFYSEVPDLYGGAGAVGGAAQPSQIASGSGGLGYFGSALTSSATMVQLFASQSISGAADGFRSRVKNISFNNTTELNSTIYFCRANHNEFNYSSNPTYVSGSKIVVKDNTTDLPISYITTIGMYSADNELLAMAKISEPLKKDPNTELTLRVRLDY